MSAREDEPGGFRVELVTPDGPVFSDEAAMVVVPGAEGQLGVLPRHMPLVARLNAGETRIKSTREEAGTAYATGPGYFRVAGQTATVLVSHAEKADEIDVARAESDLVAARERLEAAEGDAERESEAERARLEIADAENRLAVAGR